MYEVLLQKQLTLDSGKTTHMTTVGQKKRVLDRWLSTFGTQKGRLERYQNEQMQNQILMF